MGRTRKEAQVGIIVLLSLLVLIVGMLWFKQYRFAGGTTLYSVDFPAVDALQVRDRVQVRGIRMGAVDNLQIIDDFVRVTLHVDHESDLREDAQFRLMTIGIVGEKVIEIDPGMGDAVLEGHIFKGEMEVSLTGMGAAASEALDEVRDLAREVRVVISELTAEDRFASTIAATQGAMADVEGVVADNRDDLRAMIQNLELTSGAVRAALAGPDSALAEITTGARTSLARADSLLTSLESISSSLQIVAARLEAGEGSAGRLLTDDGLYSRAESTMTAVEELVDDVKRNPRKYFKFSVIDF